MGIGSADYFSERQEELRSVRRRRRMRTFLIYAVLIILSIIALLPVMWMVSISLTPLNKVFQYPPRLIPDPLSLTGYHEAVTLFPFFRYFLNTSFMTAARVIGTVFSASLVAYGFARYDGPLKEVLFVFILTPIFLPEQVTLIPLFVGYTRLGWIDTYNPLVLPAFFGGSAVYIFLLRQFFMTIPTDLDDAARIDGASEFAIYWRIILPLAKPALATVAIFTFMASWNDFLGPLIYLTSKEKLPLSVGLSRFLGESGTTLWNSLMAAAILTVLPPILLFVFAQKYIMQGIAITGGGAKG